MRTVSCILPTYGNYAALSTLLQMFEGKLVFSCKIKSLISATIHITAQYVIAHPMLKVLQWNNQTTI